MFLHNLINVVILHLQQVARPTPPTHPDFPLLQTTLRQLQSFVERLNVDLSATVQDLARDSHLGSEWFTVRNILPWEISYIRNILHEKYLTMRNIFPWEISYIRNILPWELSYHEKYFIWEISYHEKYLTMRNILSWEISYHEKYLIMSNILHEKYLTMLLP